MDEKEKFLAEVEELAGTIEYICAKNDIATDMLRATLDCFLRLPLTTPETTLKLLESILEMAKQKIDFSLLLKAGVMMGMSYDYSRFKRAKRLLVLRKKQNKEAMEKLKTMADDLKKQGYEAEVGVSSAAPMLCCNIPIGTILEYKKLAMLSRNFGDWRLDADSIWSRTPEPFQKIAKDFAPGSDFLFKKKVDVEEIFSQLIAKYGGWQIDNIKKILSLDTTQWQITSVPISRDHIEIVIESVRTPECIVPVKEDPFLRRSVFDECGGICVDETMQEESENMSFIAIYQKCLLNHHLYRVKTELEHLFAVRNGRVPDANELSSLRMRYYKFIRKAYPSAMTDSAEASIGRPTTRYLAGPAMRLHEEPNIFFLQSRPYSKKKSPRGPRNPYVLGKMSYDAGRKCYWLLPGTRLNGVDITKLKKYPEMAALYKKARQDRSLVIHRLRDPSSDNESASREKTEQTADSWIEIVSVAKKIQVPSSSFAAHLVLGYKRNGPDCWKNAYGKTLREYLKSIERPSKEEISSESVLPPPTDQGEDRNGD